MHKTNSDMDAKLWMKIEAFMDLDSVLFILLHSLMFFVALICIENLLNSTLWLSCESFRLSDLFCLLWIKERFLKSGLLDRHWIDFIGNNWIRR